jgi:hypothetical protein
MHGRILSPTSALVIVLLLAAGCAAYQSNSAGSIAPQEGDYIARDFPFRSGETLPELRLHYRTLGKPAHNASGQVTNAVLILHGTGGSGQQFLAPQFANVLFGPSQLLDASRSPVGNAYTTDTSHYSARSPIPSRRNSHSGQGATLPCGDYAQLLKTLCLDDN